MCNDINYLPKSSKVTNCVLSIQATVYLLYSQVRSSEKAWIELDFKTRNLLQTHEQFVEIFTVKLYNIIE